MKTTITLIALFCFNICFCQDLILKGQITDEHKESIPFANIALYQTNDTINVVKGSASDLSGKYSLQNINPGNYILKVSYIGYKTESLPIHINKNIIQNIILKSDSQSLTEIVIEGKRNIRSIDKTSYTFTTTQIDKAKDGRDLIATLPNLHIDKTTNSLSTINGKSIMILINGIKATDDDLKTNSCRQNKKC